MAVTVDRIVDVLNWADAKGTAAVFQSLTSASICSILAILRACLTVVAPDPRSGSTRLSQLKAASNLYCLLINDSTLPSCDKMQAPGISDSINSARLSDLVLNLFNTEQPRLPAAARLAEAAALTLTSGSTGVP
ncbi:hypothetical protein MCOR25_010347 [Pyricularia grisea]|uniref:Uncharacterized protein n=1 Tax=Pyricularia grisea TaxID=148305 RepID=A0A6P8BMX8_PYRGI|nr:uncharacterized protein PgNI_02467 [Pyricularia grisea]KAI6350846.1 hypothetical protein MCOR25_010347 [Pyricularia grisea]TLD17807.1 hypothetical protein PgNI_02467 [Pyricularia grisea]